MRIENTPPPLRPTAARRDERGAGGADWSFASALDAQAPASAAKPAAGMGTIDGLVALQEIADSLVGRRRAVARGTALLDRLDELRLALLEGVLPRDRLEALARLAREHAQAVDDPKLAEILAEIELRAAVELAKLGDIA